MLLGAWWLAIAAGALWRRTLWQRAGGEVQALARAWGARVRPTWAGFEVVGPQLRVRWRGGIRGPRTVIRGVSLREGGPGWWPARRILERVGAPGPAGPTGPEDP